MDLTEFKPTTDLGSAYFGQGRGCGWYWVGREGAEEAAALRKHTVGHGKQRHGLGHELSEPVDCKPPHVQGSGSALWPWSNGSTSLSLAPLVLKVEIIQTP